MQTVQRLLDLPYTYITRFNDGRSTVCKLKSASCDAIIYGSLIHQLGRLNFWPKKEAKDIPHSVEVLLGHICNLAPISLPKILGASEEDHSACKAPSFKDEVRKILASIPSPVLHRHLKHMEKRSKPAVPEEDAPIEEGGGSFKLVLKSPKLSKLRN